MHAGRMGIKKLQELFVKYRLWRSIVCGNIETMDHLFSGQTILVFSKLFNHIL